MSPEEVEEAAARELRACKVASLDEWPLTVVNEGGCSCCGDDLKIACGGITGPVGGFHGSYCGKDVTGSSLLEVRTALALHLARVRHVVMELDERGKIRVTRHGEERE